MIALLVILALIWRPEGITGRREVAEALGVRLVLGFESGPRDEPVRRLVSAWPSFAGP